MGRRSKAVLTGAGTDRRNTGYYSTPAPVAEFFRHRLLSLAPLPKLVFDPCVGRGELRTEVAGRLETTGHFERLLKLRVRCPGP